MLSILFIGLGNMGAPMASHLVAAGHDVTVFNRSTHKSIDFASKYAVDYVTELTQSELAPLGKQFSTMICCVGNDQDVREIITNTPDIFNFLENDFLFIDHTTTSATLAEEMALYCQQRTGHFIDAPVSGGELGAINATLTAMVGAPSEYFNRVQSIICAYSKTITHMGNTGSGQLTKMVNQTCVAGLLQGLAEGIALAESAGLDVSQVIDTLTQGAAGSWQMKNRGVTMSNREFDFGFAIKHMIKDLKICLDHSAQANLDLPITQHVLDRYNTLDNLGFGDEDTSALIRLLSSKSP